MDEACYSLGDASASYLYSCRDAVSLAAGQRSERIMLHEGQGASLTLTLSQRGEGIQWLPSIVRLPPSAEGAVCSFARLLVACLR
jgi:hypothetical protein